MSYRFIKLSCDITKSTIWAEDHATFRMWIYLMAEADRNGIVRGTIPGFANTCRMSIEEAERAIARFESPDKYSANPANDGRRIEKVEAGWRLLNYDYYRDRQGGDPDWQKERHRKNQQAYRDRIKQQPTPDVTANRSRIDHESVTVTTEAEAYTEAEGIAKGSSSTKPSSVGERTASLEPEKPGSQPLPKKEPAPERKLAGTMPTNKSEDFPIYRDQVDEWILTYPAVDVMQELREMKAWSNANPKERKTKTGMLRFVNSWLAREQDKGGRNQGGNRVGTKQSVMQNNIREAQEFIQGFRARDNDSDATHAAGGLLRAPLFEGSDPVLPREPSGSDGRAGDRGFDQGADGRGTVLPITGAPPRTVRSANRSIPL